MKIRAMVAELFHESRRAGGRRDMMKLIVGFRNFASAPKKERSLYVYIYAENLVVKFQNLWSFSSKLLRTL